MTITNTGSGHNFPAGFPEGRTAWLAIHAYDLATGKELPIHDSVWTRTSLGVGNLTRDEIVDPNFPGCDWRIPAGSADPYALQFKAVASLGDGCPTLDLPYAAPLNLVTNKQGLPISSDGRVIDAATHPTGLPQFKDVNGNGDLSNDSFLMDTRFRPLPRPEATKIGNRYSVVIPPDTHGPIAVSAAVYYQSVEAIVALKFLGNLTDTNRNFVVEPYVLSGLCDGRTPQSEPAVVEGAPPVPMIVRNWVISISGEAPEEQSPRAAPYPLPDAQQVYRDVVPKVFLSAPVGGIDASCFTLTDSDGAAIPAMVDQIGDGVWGLFPKQVVLKPGERYTARLKKGICDAAGNCTERSTVWSFTTALEGVPGSGVGIVTGY